MRHFSVIFKHFEKFVLTIQNSDSNIIFFSPFPPFCCYCKIFAFSLGFCTQISRKYYLEEPKAWEFLNFFQVFFQPLWIFCVISHGLFLPFLILGELGGSFFGYVPEFESNNLPELPSESSRSQRSTGSSIIFDADHDSSSRSESPRPGSE